MQNSETLLLRAFFGSILAGPRLYVSLDELSALLIMRSIR